MNALAARPISARSPRIREACNGLVRHLKDLGYPHADSTSCERVLRAYFPYPPVLEEGSEDEEAGAAFLERFMSECRQRERELAQPLRPRRCYGHAVEQAVTESEARGELVNQAPRLTELMTQLDADGHNTTQLRIELEHLINELGMRQFYS